MNDGFDKMHSECCYNVLDLCINEFKIFKITYNALHHLCVPWWSTSWNALYNFLFFFINRN